MKTPTTLILFGATGDLAKKKIWKSLFDLYKKGKFPEKFNIVGFSRREWVDKDLHDFIRNNISKEKEDINDFFKNITYFKGDLYEKDSYKRLAEFLFDRDGDVGVCSNKMFFLAVPPEAYGDMFSLLASSGLSSPCAKTKDSSGVHEVDGTWTRVLVEKPFGSDINTAIELDKLLGSLFKEEQIYRIDHYLAKDTIQNILTFRFKNNVFENIWSKEYIEKIEIDMWEDVDVSSRGSLYDGLGALRDVGQNHVLQMLAIIAMDKPKEFSEEEIRKQRLILLEKVSIDEKSFIKGQYEGYLQEDGVLNDSKTETFFSVNLNINNDRWSGVPIRVVSGKALPEKKTEIRVYFKDSQNFLTFCIQPKEGISLNLLMKKAGLDYEAADRKLFSPFSEDENIPSAYEKVLYDAILGDLTVFTQTKEVSAEWNIVMPILNKWKDLVPIKYKKGTLPKN